MTCKNFKAELVLQTSDGTTMHGVKADEMSSEMRIRYRKKSSSSESGADSPMADPQTSSRIMEWQAIVAALGAVIVLLLLYIYFVYVLNIA